MNTEGIDACSLGISSRDYSRLCSECGNLFAAILDTRCKLYFGTKIKTAWQKRLAELLSDYYVHGFTIKTDCRSYAVYELYSDILHDKEILPFSSNLRYENYSPLHERLIVEVEAFLESKLDAYESKALRAYYGFFGVEYRHNAGKIAELLELPNSKHASVLYGCALRKLTHPNYRRWLPNVLEPDYGLYLEKRDLLKELAVLQEDETYKRIVEILKRLSEIGALPDYD